MVFAGVTAMPNSPHRTTSGFSPSATESQTWGEPRLCWISEIRGARRFPRGDLRVGVSAIGKCALACCVERLRHLPRGMKSFPLLGVCRLNDKNPHASDFSVARGEGFASRPVPRDYAPNVENLRWPSE